MRLEMDSISMKMITSTIPAIACLGRFEIKCEPHEMLELADCADEVEGSSCSLSLFGAVLDYKQYFLRFSLLD